MVHRPERIKKDDANIIQRKCRIYADIINVLQHYKHHEKLKYLNGVQGVASSNLVIPTLQKPHKIAVFFSFL